MQKQGDSPPKPPVKPKIPRMDFSHSTSQTPNLKLASPLASPMGTPRDCSTTHPPPMFQPLKIPAEDLGICSARSTYSDHCGEDDDEVDMSHRPPPSPTDHILSPCSRLLMRKKAPNRLSSQEFNLTSQITRRPCPVPPGCSLILGSSSSNKKEVLATVSWDVTVIDPDVDDKSIQCDDFMELPVMVARAKADGIIQTLQQSKQDEPDFQAVLLTAHQVALFRGDLREKPSDLAQAEEYLMSYSGADVCMVSAVVATHFPSHRQATEVDLSTVQWGDIPADVVQAVIARGNVLNKTGGFCIEDVDLFPLIQSIEGSVDSVLGMPVASAERVINTVLPPLKSPSKSS